MDYLGGGGGGARGMLPPSQIIGGLPPPPSLFLRLCSDEQFLSAVTKWYAAVPGGVDHA